MKRLAKKLRWLMLTMAVLLAALIVASAWRSVVWKSRASQSGYVIASGAESGLMLVAFGQDSTLMPPGGIGPGWTWDPYGPRSPRLYWVPIYEPTPMGTTIGIPVWPFVLLAGACSVWSFLLARLPPPGCCKSCGYNLAGVTAKLCPECGSDAGPVPSANR